MLLTYFLSILQVTSCKKYFYCKFPSHLFFLLLFMQMYMTHHCACKFIICNLEDGCSWVQNNLGKMWHLFEFIPFRSLIRWLERTNNRIDRNEDSAPFNQTQFFLNIMKGISLTRKSSKHCAQYTELLDSFCDLIKSYQRDQLTWFVWYLHPYSNRGHSHL